MSTFHPKRIWFWIAVAAIAFAVVTLLLPHHGNAADQNAWVALLPVFFVGLIAPSSLALYSVLELGLRPQEPTPAPSFQRPPPALI